MADEEQRLRDIQREYLDFLDDEVYVFTYFDYFVVLIIVCLEMFCSA